MTAAHVIPIADTQEHSRQADCPCGPRYEELDDGRPMYVHNAYDGRVMAESMGYERLPWALEWQRME